MNWVRRLFDRSRPRFWLYLAGPVLVGVAYGAPTLAAVVSPIAVVLFAYYLIPANVYLYGINDVFDATIDRENPKKYGREIRYRGGEATLAAVAVAGAIGLSLVWLLPPVAGLSVLGFLVLGAAYSAPPIRLKTKPPLDSLSNGLYVLPGAAAYAALSGAEPPTLALLGGWCWAMAMHTFSAVPDIESDRLGGIRTTATVLGRRGAIGYCVACWLLAVGLFAFLDPRAGVLLAVYPAIVGFVLVADVDVDRAYWWFPAINTGVGMALTLGGLWGIVHG